MAEKNRFLIQPAGTQASPEFRRAAGNYTGNSRFIAIDQDGNVTELGNTPPPGVSTSISQNREAAIARAQAAADRSGSLIAQAEANPDLLGDPAFREEFDAAQAEVQASQEELNQIQASESAASESADSTSEKPCPDCGNVPGTDKPAQQSVNKKKKPVSDTNSWYPSQPFAGLNFFQAAAKILESVGSFFNNLLDVFDIKEGNCRTCEGKRTVEDKSVQTEEINRTVAAANAQKDKLIELESKASGGTGLGGNDVKFVVGNKFVKVGAAYNDSQSYESIPDGKQVPSGCQIDKKGVTKRGAFCAQVNGCNPLPTLGGNYTMEIGNHYKLRAGAQGIELSTEGPLVIKAGQTQIVGPELAIGSATGEVNVSGKHTQIGGDSIAITPGRGGDGQVTIQGTAYCSGNIVATGGAHIDGDLSFISATCPYKEDRSKHSSQETEYNGPARWSLEAARQGLKDYLRTSTIRTLDPSLITVSPRQILNFYMDYIELVEKALPLELLPTGLILPGECVVVGVGVAVNPGPIPIYNFPHHHTLTDMIHAHNMRVPNINLVEDDEQVRSAAKPKELRAPVPINKESALLKLFELIQLPYQLVVAGIQRLGGGGGNVA